MKMRVSLLAVALVGLPAAAEVAITPVGEHVSVRAVAAPLNEVLEQLARRTGMKVTYEGGQPRQPITLTVEDRTSVQAVLAVMEGQGLNFGLRMDASGTRVDRLLVLGLAPATAGATSSASASHAPVQVLPPPVEEEREDPIEIDQPDPEPPQPPPGLGPPGQQIRRPGPRGPVSGAAPSPAAPAESGDSVHGGSPFAPRATPFPTGPFQPQQKDEPPPN